MEQVENIETDRVEDPKPETKETKSQVRRHEVQVAAPAAAKPRKPRVTQRSVDTLDELDPKKMTEAEKITMITHYRDMLTGGKNLINELKKQATTMYQMKCSAEGAYKDVYDAALKNQMLLQDNIEMLYRNSKMLRPLARLHNGTLNDEGGQL